MATREGDAPARKRDVPARKRDAEATRLRILEAAFEAFSARGYGASGVREIAEAAGVASSLVMRYFGSKAGLFERSLVHAIKARALFPEDRSRFGTSMARLMTERYDTRLTAMTVLAIGDPEAEEIIRRVVARDMIAPLAEWLGGPDPMGRATAMFALMTGFTMQMRLNRPRPVPQGSIAFLAAAFQQLVDGVDGRAPEAEAQR